MNSYETMQRLVAAKLATVSTNGHLDTFKYTRRVMFDYLWDTDPALLETRGHSHGNLTGAKGKMLDVGLDNSYNLYGKHRFFSELDVLNYMARQELVITDHHKERE